MFLSRSPLLAFALASVSIWPFFVQGHLIWSRRIIDHRGNSRFLQQETSNDPPTSAINTRESSHQWDPFRLLNVGVLMFFDVFSFISIFSHTDILLVPELLPPLLVIEACICGQSSYIYAELNIIRSAIATTSFEISPVRVVAVAFYTLVDSRLSPMEREP